ncbi:MAG TPA: hypothetical protein VGQ30_03170 [Gemmatimonadaceae bacterium]|jgi:hypothetical protein|nr:hypothetical protein [Gemmatimonadaceae bacterium]
MANPLGALFAFFFKYRPAVFQQGDFTFGAPAPMAIMLIAGAAIAIPAVLSYARVRGKSSPRDRMILRGLRIAALVVLMVCLLRPMLVLNAAVPQRNFVGVLIDDSRSMQIADRGGRQRADWIRDSVTASNSALVKSLRERFQVKFFHFGASAEKLDDATTLKFDANETKLGAALEGARRELEMVPLSGLVVLTDGADNSRAPIADELLSLRAKQVPVFAVGIGSEKFARDIEVRRVETSGSVLKGSTLVADVLVRQRGFGGAKLPLMVEDDGHLIGQSEITLPPDGDVAPVRVEVKMSTAGARLLTFRIPLQSGEQVTQNNAQQALVRVRDAREKILYVEGEPRYEMRFVRAAVEADSNLQLVALQRTADRKFLRLNVDGPNELVNGFPVTRSELYSYRAIVLGSIEASFFTHAQLAMLADFVNVRGGGLLMLGGRRAFGEGGYAGTPLADVMPVVIEGNSTGDSLSFLADLTASVTPSGASHAVTQVTLDPVKSAERWRTLPAVTSVNRIRRVKPGAVTLIDGRVPKAGREGVPDGAQLHGYEQPLLVFQRYGRGLSIAMPIQDSWTWEFDSSIPYGDPTFPTFWKQLLRFLTSDVPGRVTVHVATDQVNPRTPVDIRAEIADSAFLSVNDAQVVAHVSGGAGPARDVPLEWAVDRDGEYRASFTPTDPGIYTVRVDAKARDGSVSSDSTFVRVADLNAEYVDAEMRAALLQRLARETGGRFYTPETVGTLAADVAMSKRGVTVANEMDLWDMPVNFLLLVAVLCAEWAYRKSRGLA